jgi:sulfite exporter TauE/SafE
MSIEQIISMAVVMGLIGSFHCLGMCGPIAMALPMGHRSNSGRLLGGVIYNLGRVFTYSWLGLVLGMAGDFLISPKIQSTVSIVFGAVIVVYLLLPSNTKRFLKISPSQNLLIRLRKQLAKFLYIQNNSSLFGIGMLNGLLPCGMIYLALASSFVAGSAVKGSLFMFSFGLGTFPTMLAAVYFGSFLNQHIRARLRRLVPVFLFFMAALLIVRGMNLGIPYISPSLPVGQLQHEAVTCH